jgi:hypothetical protein
MADVLAPNPDAQLSTPTQFLPQDAITQHMPKIVIGTPCAASQLTTFGDINFPLLTKVFKRGNELPIVVIVREIEDDDMDDSDDEDSPSSPHKSRGEIFRGI